MDGFASIGALCETETGFWVLWSEDVAAAYCRAFAAAAEFAAKCGERWIAAVKAYEERPSIFDDIRQQLVARGVISA